MFEVLVEGGFSAAHALRNYRGRMEPLHGHNFRIQVVVRGKRLQNKVKYLTDFVALQATLGDLLRPMDHINLNTYPPFDRENPTSENLALYLYRRLRQRWRSRGVRIASVTVWETSETAARYIVAGA